MKTSKTEFQKKILLPILAVALIFFLFEINIVGIILLILFIDGIIGCFRSHIHKLMNYEEVAFDNIKVIKNKYIPFGNFESIMLFSVLFTKSETELSEKSKIHETIHYLQGSETGWLLFYVLYIFDFLCNFISEFFKNKFKLKQSFHKAYELVCFELEARYVVENHKYKYLNLYLNCVRKDYNWLKYF